MYQISVSPIRPYDFRVKSRRQRSPHGPAERPTRRKILDQAVFVLLEDGFDRFSVQRVLDGAEVSRATLYRYFPDVDGLIEEALVETFRREVDRFLNVAGDLVERSSDLASFRVEVRKFFETFSTIPAVIRLRRTHTFALASTRPKLASSIAVVQESLTDGWAATIREAQRKGFIRDDIDSRAIAVMIQSMGLGRIVDDAAVSHIGDELWASTFFEFVNRSVIVPDF
jgi:AcrR family transcriptional regulator